MASPRLPHRRRAQRSQLEPGCPLRRSQIQGRRLMLTWTLECLRARALASRLVAVTIDCERDYG
eukprot:scaffold138008_cov31-Tisochrysis_lutea.AAC.5